jgi:N utilization substance protein B
MAKNKRKARVLALQVMYAYDLRQGDDIALLFEDIVKGNKASKEITEYARLLINKARENSKEIDSILQIHTANWDIKRMSAVDRNVLRLAIAELLYMEDVPFKVVIDEAVEIAKKYGTNDSGKFVNGVIDAIYKKRIKKE